LKPNDNENQRFGMVRNQQDGACPSFDQSVSFFAALYLAHLAFIPAIMAARPARLKRLLVFLADLIVASALQTMTPICLVAVSPLSEMIRGAPRMLLLASLELPVPGSPRRLRPPNRYLRARPLVKIRNNETCPYFTGLISTS
jgi:hypothetical protein